MDSQDTEAKNAARIDLAVKCIGGGNLAAANVLCWNVLDHDKGRAQAWNLLGIIAARLQLWERATEFFATAHDHGMAEAQENLRQVSAAAPPSRAPAQERFLLIKAWGAGFWSDVSHVLGGLILAETTARKPIVHWGSNSRFGDRTGRNAFPLFFEAVSDRTIDDLTAFEDSDFFPPKWRTENLLEEDNAKWAGPGAQLDAIYLLNRPEKVVVADFYISVANFAPLIPRHHPLSGLSVADLYRYAIQKYFRPRGSILDQAKAFFDAKLAGGPFVATHMRGSDKVRESTFTADSERFRRYVTRETFKILDQVDPSYRIFLMTDDERIAEQTASRYGSRIVMTPSERSDNEMGVHFKATTNPRLGIEVMVDVFLALQATAFIGFGGTNVAAMIALLRDWPPKRCVLIGPSVLLRRGQMPYLDKQFRELEAPDSVAS